MNYFDEIIGYEDIKEKLLTLDDYYKHPEVYKELNAKPFTNIIIKGNRGSGKTSLVMALAKTMGLPVYKLEKQPDQKAFFEEIKKVFKEATENAPSILFMKDIDTYQYDDDFEQEYNIISGKIEELEKSDKQVFVIATTHYRKIPTEKMFATVLELSLPPITTENAVKIADKYIKEKGYKVDFSTEDMVRMLRFKGVKQIDFILSQAAALAARNRHDKITEDDIMGAFLYNNKQQYKEDADVFSDINEKDIVYFHEAGHLISMIVYEDALKDFAYACAYEEGNNRYCGKVAKCRNPEESLKARLLTRLCAEAAVEVFFGTNVTGSESDYIKAIELISEQVEKEDCNFRTAFPKDKSYISESLIEKREAAVHHELMKYKILAHSIIFDYKDMVREFAKELKRNGYLLYSKVKEISSNTALLDQSLL